MSRNHNNPSALFGLRTMVIIAISLVVGLGAGGLTYFYLSPARPATAVIAVVIAFAGSVKFLNDIVATDDDHASK